MAISIQAQLAKKVPIPGISMSSQQASITITAEVTDLTQVVAEAQRLYALAEQAVDAQLGSTTPAASPPAPSSSSPAPASQTRQASQPYRGAQRRGPTPSQLSYISSLIQQTHTSLPAILEHHQVGSLEQLTPKAASGLIEELRSRVPA